MTNHDQLELSGIRKNQQCAMQSVCSHQQPTGGQVLSVVANESLRISVLVGIDEACYETGVFLLIRMLMQIGETERA